MGRIDFIAPPEQATLVITGRCNLHCGYCYYADEMTHRSDLPLSEWQKFIGELGDLGVMRVTLTGGEVFLQRGLFDLIDCVIDARMRYGLITNATLVTPENIARFFVGKRLQRLDFIQVSIDGHNAKIHNQSRPASFERAVRGLGLLQAAGLPVTARVTLNRANVDSIDQTVAFLLDDIGLNTISTGEVLSVGGACRPGVSLALTAEEKRTAALKLFQLEKQYPGRIQASAGPQVSLRMYAEMEKARTKGALAQDWEMGCLSACGCVFTQIEVLHDGAIVPCTMMSGPVLGHINRDSLQDIWEVHPVLRRMRKRNQIPMTALEQCRDCEWNLYCNGGCPGGVFQQQQDFCLPDSQFCYRQYLEELPAL